MKRSRFGLCSCFTVPMPPGLCSDRRFLRGAFLRGAPVRGGKAAKGVQGFTLVEVVTVMLIIGILAAFAFPAYQDMTRRSQLTSATQELATAVRQARAEAIRRATTIYLVQKNKTDDSALWQVRTADGYGGDNDAETLYVYQLGQNRLIKASIVAPASAKSVEFMPRGNLGKAATKIKLEHNNDSTGNIVRCVTIDRTGNITLARDAEAKSNCVP